MLQYVQLISIILKLLIGKILKVPSDGENFHTVSFEGVILTYTWFSLKFV